MFIRFPKITVTEYPGQRGMDLARVIHSGKISAVLRILGVKFLENQLIMIIHFSPKEINRLREFMLQLLAGNTDGIFKPAPRKNLSMNLLYGLRNNIRNIIY
jgi:hypothetical protein